MAGPTFADGVVEWTTTAGTTRPYVLSGTIAGSTRFRDAVTDGDWVFCSVTQDGGPGFEFLQARFTAPNQLTPIEVLRSSADGEAVTWPTGGRRFIRLQPASAAYVAGLEDEMFWTTLGLSAASDLGAMGDASSVAIDMGDLSVLGAGVLPAADLRRVIDLGEVP